MIFGGAAGLWELPYPAKPEPYRLLTIPNDRLPDGRGSAGFRESWSFQKAPPKARRIWTKCMLPKIFCQKRQESSYVGTYGRGSVTSSKCRGSERPATRSPAVNLDPLAALGPSFDLG